MGDEKLDELSYNYLTLATQYYVAGRAAVQSGLMPVGGNLLHHALEMYLKAKLCQTVSTEDLRNRKKFGHSLTQAWDKFKLLVDDSTISKFDSVIKALNQFHDLRYPEKVPKYSNVWSQSSEKVFIKTTDARVNQYRLILGDIDELVGAVLGKSEIKPQVLKDQLSQDAISILSLDNSAAIWK